jgi:hypothetical protein
MIDDIVEKLDPFNVHTCAKERTRGDVEGRKASSLRTHVYDSGVGAA